MPAAATVESWWRMRRVGDNGDSFGLFQARRPFHCTEPAARGYVREGKRRLKARTWRTRGFRAG